MFVPNHLHLLVKGYIKTPPKTDKVLNIWFTQLVNNVGMKDRKKKVERVEGENLRRFFGANVNAGRRIVKENE